MKVQVVDAEYLAGPREGSADGVGRVRKDSIVTSRHQLDIGDSFGRSFAPNVVTDLVAWIFHIAEQHGISCRSRST